MENVFSDILVKISDLLQKQNKTQKELCDYLGINGNVYTAWKNGRNKSYTKHLPKIAQFFEISVEISFFSSIDISLAFSTLPFFVTTDFGIFLSCVSNHFIISS